MTRAEFDQISTYDGLMNICFEYNLRSMEDVMDSDYMNEFILDYLHSTNRSWEDIRYDLNDIDPGYCYYEYRGGLEFDALDEYDFGAWMEEVANEMERKGCFDDDEDEDDDVDTWDAYTAPSETKEEWMEPESANPLPLF